MRHVEQQGGCELRLSLVAIFAEIGAWPAEFARRQRMTEVFEQLLRRSGMMGLHFAV